MAGLKMSPHNQDIRRRAKMAGMNAMIAKGA
jgi:hypothetical protein